MFTLFRSHSSTLSAGLVAIAATVSIIAAPAANAQVTVFNSEGAFTSATNGLTTITFNDIAPDNGFTDYSQTGLNVGPIFNGSYQFIPNNGGPTTTQYLLGVDDGFASINGVPLYTVGNSASLYGGFTQGTATGNYIGTISATFATAQNAVGTQFRNYGAASNPAQDFRVDLFSGNTLVGTTTITALTAFNPNSPQFVGLTSISSFDRIDFTGINPLLEQSGALSLDNFRFGTEINAVAAVPEPGEWATMGLAATGLCGLMVRARRRKI